MKPEELPGIARSEIAAIMARDKATSRAVWFDGPDSFSALAARDRARLLDAMRWARMVVIATMCLPASSRRSSEISLADARMIAEFLEATVDLT